MFRPTLRVFVATLAIVLCPLTITYADCSCDHSGGCDCAERGCDDPGCCDNGGCDNGGCDSCGRGHGNLLGNLLARLKGNGCRNCKSCCPHEPYTENSHADLFYNFYVPNCQGAAAAAYPAPYPTPAHVGHTYYTYQPLMPHEFLYRHLRTYHQYYNNGMGLNRTKVTWYRNPFACRSCLKSGFIR